MWRANSEMNQNKKKALTQVIFSVVGAVAFIISYFNQNSLVSKVSCIIVTLFFIILLIDGLRRLFKRIEPTTMGKFEG